MWLGHPDLYKNELEELLYIPDDSDIGDFSEIDLRYPINMKEKTKKFPFCPEDKFIPNEKYNDYMEKIKPRNDTKAKKLICYWTDKKIYLVDYRLVKVHVRLCTIVDKNHEIIS